MSSSYRQELDKYLKTLSVKKGIVLDIGGAQNPLDDRLGEFTADDYFIADLEEPHEDHAPIDFIIDLNESFRLDFEGKKFKADWIFCLEVFEYIWNPMQALKNIHDHLLIGGTAIVSFPFVYPTHQPIDQDYLRYTEAGVKKLAHEAGLKIKRIIPRRPVSNGLQMFYSLEKMRAAKGYDHAVTGWIVEFTR